MKAGLESISACALELELSSSMSCPRHVCTRRAAELEELDTGRFLFGEYGTRGSHQVLLAVGRTEAHVIATGQSPTSMAASLPMSAAQKSAAEDYPNHFFSGLA